MKKITKKHIKISIVIISVIIITASIIYKLPEYGKASYTIALPEFEYDEYANDENKLRERFPLGEEIEIELFSTRYKNIFKPHDGKVVLFINGERFVCYYPFTTTYDKKKYVPILSLFEMWYHRIINDEYYLISFRKFDDVEYDIINNKTYVHIRYGMFRYGMNVNADKTSTFLLHIYDNNGTYAQYIEYIDIKNFLGFKLNKQNIKTVICSLISIILLILLFTYKKVDYGLVDYTVHLKSTEAYNDEAEESAAIPVGKNITLELHATRFKNIFSPHMGTMDLYLDGQHYVCRNGAGGRTRLYSYDIDTAFPVLYQFQMWYKRLTGDYDVILAFYKNGDITKDIEEDSPKIQLNYEKVSDGEGYKLTLSVSAGISKSAYGEYEAVLQKTDLFDFK